MSSRRYPRRAAASAALLCAALLSCTGADRSTSRTDSGGVASYTCLTPPPLLGLRLGDNVASLRAALGQPLDSVPSTGDGDRGVTYRYRRTDVRVVRHYVDRVTTTAAGGWPRGLAVGSTRAEVDQYTIQHRLLRTTSDNAIEIVVCPDDRVMLHLAPFAGARRVRRVELISGRG